MEGTEVPPAAPAFPGMGRSVQRRSHGITCFLLLPCRLEELTHSWPLRTKLAGLPSALTHVSYVRDTFIACAGVYLCIRKAQITAYVL